MLPCRGIAAAQDELKASAAEVASLKSQIALAKTAALASKAEAVGSDGATLLVEGLEGVAAGDLQGAAASLQKQLGEKAAVVLVSPSGDGKVRRCPLHLSC